MSPYCLLSPFSYVFTSLCRHVDADTTIGSFIIMVPPCITVLFAKTINVYARMCASI